MKVYFIINGYFNFTYKLKIGFTISQREKTNYYHYSKKKKKKVIPITIPTIYVYTVLGGEMNTVLIFFFYHLWFRTTLTYLLVSAKKKVK